MKTSRIIGILCICLFMVFSVNAQTSYHDIKSASGDYAYSYNQVPAALLGVNAAVAGASYQWQQSNMPLTGFTDMALATGATYNFSTALNQTLYFRRKATIGTEVYYSNAIKLELVSVNWENINYVRQHDVTVSGQTNWQGIDQLPIGSKMQSTTYFDNFGRPTQQVARELATPAEGSNPANPWPDMVQFSKYDPYGRTPRGYLPYTSASNAGKFKSNAETEQSQYYAAVYNETAPYNRVEYDNSPLDRVLKSYRPGTAWAASAGVTALYDMSTAADEVQFFTLAYSAGAVPQRVAIYAANLLFRIKTTDEQGRQQVDYYNKGGQLILHKTQLADNPSAAHSGWICTYNIYDDFGLLRFQLQPEAVNWLESNGWNFTGTNGQQMLDGLCFRYEYDSKGRTTLKKAPGAEALLMLYDARDRVIFMQDGNQRAKSPAEWTANIYDELDRVKLTTLYRTNKTVAELQTDINNSYTIRTLTLDNVVALGTDLVVNHRDPLVLNYIASNSIDFTVGFQSEEVDIFGAEILTGQTNTSITVSVQNISSAITQASLNNPAENTILKYLYYDDYGFAGAQSFSTAHENNLAYSSGTDAIGWSKRTLSTPTGSMVRVLGSEQFLINTIYYDDKGRPVQSHEENIKGGTDVTTSQYHFDGRLMSDHTRHSTANTGYSSFSIITKYLFDKIGRVNGVQKKYGGNAFTDIATYSMDDMGRLKSKKLAPGYTGSGSTRLEELKYSYNIHNYITGINKDYALKTSGQYSKWGNFFGMYLGYENSDNLFAASQLTGRVTGIAWNTQGDDAQRKYDFSYDNAGRLTGAAFNEKQQPGDAWSHSSMDFSVTGNSGKITYDLNGNLLNMIQKGVLPGSPAPATVDNLAYTYNALSNQLIKVTDNGSLATQNGKLGDFKDGSNGTANDYVYDANGNIITDLNKNAKELGGVLNAPGIHYNFLDKPDEIRIAGKGVIKIVYTADGEKLQKIFTPEGGGTAVTTTYISEFVYRENLLQYINFEEGRVRVMDAVNENNNYDYLTLDGNISLPVSPSGGGARGAYDYFVRDYQGNVRMILTTETHTGGNSCTMELNRDVNEEPIFGQVDANGVPTGYNEVVARFAVSGIPGQSTNNGWTNTTIGNYVSRVGNLSSSKLGPNTLLKVMAGDEMSATTIYYYKNAVSNSNSGNGLLSTIISGLVNAISGSSVTSGVVKDGATGIGSQLNTNNPFQNITSPDATNPGGTNPKAYLTMLFFDERFNYVGEGSTALRVQQAGNNAAPLAITNVKAPKNGYVYIYVSNQSDEHVYFDNIQVTHNRGRIIEEDHYYAYGLKIAGISSAKLPDSREGHIGNFNFYNDKELVEDADLDWYDYGFRFYDPQIGRFPQLDPLTFEYPYYTPYQYAGCEPIANVDMDGLEPSITTLATVVVTSGGSAANAAAKASYLALKATTTTYQVYQFVTENADGSQSSYLRKTPPTSSQVSVNGQIYTYDQQFTVTETKIEEVNTILDADLAKEFEKIKAARDSEQFLEKLKYKPISGNIYQGYKWKNGFGNTATTPGTAEPGMGNQDGGSMIFDGITAASGTGIVKKLLNSGGKIAVTRTPSVLGHIFREEAGHVNPLTLTSQNRYINLFEKVTNNPMNINPNVLTNFQRTGSGFQGFSQTFRNGKQVWTQTVNGKIINAGVNPIPR